MKNRCRGSQVEEEDLHVKLFVEEKKGNCQILQQMNCKQMSKLFKRVFLECPYQIRLWYFILKDKNALNMVICKLKLTWKILLVQIAVVFKLSFNKEESIF